MTKQEAIEIVNNHSRESSLNNGNTNIAKINDAKNVWWFNIPPERFLNDLHLLLKKANGLIWLKINANTFIKPQDVFRLRTDVGKIDLEISSNKQNNYMVDIKSGGTNYNFNQHIEHEFNN
ncbi:hypothetical protein SPBRAN_1136 [uncultured Candidatus Thioglobus sp.]|nr:hypothetical protein SPBRAN_1136 [uncultured Candidatus Thioglobus sp.]